MSAKHSIVPRGFTAADAEGCNLNKFEFVTARQARALAQAGIIRQLGASGKVWQRVDDNLTRPSEETGNGRVSLEVPRSIKDLLTAEMGGRPGWGLEECVA
jgi:hypothetical protein